MTSFDTSRWFLVLLAIGCMTGLVAPAGVHASTLTSTTNSSKLKSRPGSQKRAVNKAKPGSLCLPCKAAVLRGRKEARGRKAFATELPCHSKDYLDPKIRKNYRAALNEMKRAGLKPKVTSQWRSSGYQARLHRCSLSRRCRINHPGLYRALPPGNSIHEAGFAVDIAGVATGPRGAKRLTARGRRIIPIMKRHGFNWRYGLKDPVHFEGNPQRFGYRSVKHAIKRNQTVCDVKLASVKKQVRRSRGNVRAQAAPARKRLSQQKRMRAQVSSVQTRRVAKSRA
ncbi:MAG: D-alanyl-D-alanine carboxypeptidase family protein [Blastocatellia bacterium]